MKRKILSLVLAMTLALAYAVPVAAAEADVQATEDVAAVEVTEPAPAVSDEAVPNTADPGEKVSDDPAVQEAYDTYIALEKALADGDLAALKEAYNYLSKGEFETEAQQEEFDKIIDEKIGYEESLVALFSAAYVIDAADKYDAYKANKNIGTAYDFVDAVDTVTEDCELSMESFVPGISADYEDAKANYLPAENVLTVYKAYEELVLYSVELHYYDEDFFAAYEGFEAVLDEFNALTEDELADLAELMGVEDGEAAWNQIFSVWVNASTVMELGEAYTAYTEKPGKDTAAALVEVYERVFLSKDFFIEEDFELFREFFFDIDDVYAEAKALVTEDKAPSEETVTNETTAESDKSDKDNSPATGDDFNAAPYAAIMVIAAAVAGLAVKRRKVQ